MKWFTKLMILMTLFGVLKNMTSGECIYCHRCVDDTCRDPVNNRCYCEYGCKQGYYGNVCRNECPEQCYSCGRNYGWNSDPTYGICYECKDGYHNGSSTNCLCPINCQQCTSTTQCTVCKQGWYGTMCQSSCSPNCKGQLCHKDAGSCNNGCNDGWFGTECRQECSATCKGSICQQDDGICDKCIPGKYGSNCNTDCPSSNCLNNECDRNDGICTNGCTGNFVLGTNNLCQTCKAGKYGSNCNTDCPSGNCLNNECDTISGMCNGCTGNFVLGNNYLCQACIPGKYGPNCNTDCPSGSCLNNECDTISGMCNGCTGNFVLGTTNLCQTCKAGKYGPNCNTDCPSGNCLNNECDRNNGFCNNGCMTGYYDDMCNSNCSTNCLDDVCNQTTGKCESCETGFHGKTCQYECSKNCINETCSQDDAECFHGCINGFHGQTCQQVLGDEDKEENNIVGPVAGSVAGFVVIVIGVMAFLMFRKWKGNKDKNPSNALSSSNDDLRTAATDRRDDNAVYQNDRLNRMVDPVEIDIEDNEDQLADGNDVDAEYANAPLSTTKIRIMDLYTFVTQTEYEHFKTEFGRLPRSALHSYECAKKSENRALNRFRGIYPYDHSRVKLKHDPTFFINACYIDGYNRDKAYIASVGPTAAITNGYISFWTMVWYENVDKIVILTKLQEERVYVVVFTF